MNINPYIISIPYRAFAALSPLFVAWALLSGCKDDRADLPTAEQALVTLSLRSGGAVSAPDPNVKDGDNLFTKLYVAVASENGEINVSKFVNISSGSSAEDIELQVPAGYKTFYALAYNNASTLSMTDQQIMTIGHIDQLLALTASDGRAANAQVFSGRTARLSILASDRNRVIDLSIMRSLSRIDLYIHKNKAQLGDAPMRIKEINITNLRGESPLIFPLIAYNDPIDFNKIKAFLPHSIVSESSSIIVGTEPIVPEDKPDQPQYIAYSYPVFPNAGATPEQKPRISIKTLMADGTVFDYKANIEDDNQTAHKGDLLPNHVYKVDAELGDRTADIKLEVLPWGTEPYRREVYLFREFEIEVLNQEYSTHLLQLGAPKAVVRIKRTIGGLSSNYKINVLPGSGQFVINNPQPTAAWDVATKTFSGLQSEPVGKQYSFDLSYDISGTPAIGSTIATIEISMGSGVQTKRTLVLKVLPPKS